MYTLFQFVSSLYPHAQGPEMSPVKWYVGLVQPVKFHMYGIYTHAISSRYTDLHMLPHIPLNSQTFNYGYLTILVCQFELHK